MCDCFWSTYEPFMNPILFLKYGCDRNTSRSAHGSTSTLTLRLRQWPRLQPRQRESASVAAAYELWGCHGVSVAAPTSSALATRSTPEFAPVTAAWPCDRLPARAGGHGRASESSSAPASSHIYTAHGICRGNMETMCARPTQKSLVSWASFHT